MTAPAAQAVDTFFPFLNQTLSNAQWQAYARMFRNDGIVNSDLAGILSYNVAAGGGLVAQVAAGRAIVQGIFCENATQKNFTLGTADPTNPRIDTVVIRLTQATPTVQLAVLEGVAAGSPVPLALTQTASVYEVPLAFIRINAAAGSFASLTDARNWSGSGFARSQTVASVAGLTPASPGTIAYAGNSGCVTIPVSGTNTITSMPAAAIGNCIILEFASAACQVTAGSNLKMPRNYVSTVLGTLMFESDGTNWVEVARTGEAVAANLVYRGPTSGAVAKADWGALVAADFPAWTTWVPAFLQSGAVTTSSVLARVCQLGKMATINCYAVFNSSGGGATAIGVTLPAGLTLHGTNHAVTQCVGSFRFLDTSVPSRYAGAVVIESTTSLIFQVDQSNTGVLGVLPSFTVATGDTLGFTVQVELA